MDLSDSTSGLFGHRLPLPQEGRGFLVRGRSLDPAVVVRVLRPYVSEARANRIESVVSARSRSVVPVVEGAANLGNIGAVMRTAEALGFLDFHVIMTETQYKRSSRTTQGADKWLDVFAWPDVGPCIRYLKDSGYRLITTGVGDDSRPIDEVDFARPTAIVFGNEVGGVSAAMCEAADERCSIPMQGMVESLNISVAAAICLEKARQARARLHGGYGDLPEPDREVLRAAYYVRSVRRAESLLHHHAPGGAMTSG